MFMLPKSQQRYFLTAVLFALLARALVPAGFMPTATADLPLEIGLYSPSCGTENGGQVTCDTSEPHPDKVQRL
jgi:hypothetical protein